MRELPIINFGIASPKLEFLPSANCHIRIHQKPVLLARYSFDADPEGRGGGIRWLIFYSLATHYISPVRKTVIIRNSLLETVRTTGRPVDLMSLNRVAGAADSILAFWTFGSSNRHLLASTGNRLSVKLIL